MNISQTGLLVLSDTVPPAVERIWIRLESPATTEWVEVVMIGATSEAQGPPRLRLAFRVSCHYDFFKSALYRKPGS